MKVIDVERIDTEENQILDKENIGEIIETPLIESIEKFNEKGIKTLMSSCNKYNVNWINESGTNVFVDGLRDDLHYKDIYNFGYGYAYIMMDFDSLSEENKKLMQQMYVEANKEVEEEKLQNYYYGGKKNVIYGAVPSVMMVGRMGSYTKDGWKIRPGIHFSLETIKEDSLNTEDEFFLENFNIVATSTKSPRIVIVRYPVNENTEALKVTEYFNGIANTLVNQKEDEKTL